MSDIYLAMADIDSSQLEKASRKLKDAAEVLQKTYNAMRSYDSNLFELYDYWTGYVFSENSSSTVYKQMNSLYSLADSLDAAGALCKNGPDAMAEIDADCRKTLTGWWGSGNAGRTYYGSGTMSGRRGAQSRFFASRSGVTGEDTDVGVEQEDTTSRYQSIVDEFDWSKTSATDEEIEAVVAAASIEICGLMPEDNIRRRLSELYESKCITENIVVPYSEGVTKGKIRYVDQSYGHEKENEWGDHARAANYECCTACQSMALSYLGIDRSPDQLLDTGKNMECGDSWEPDIVRGTDNVMQTGEWTWNQENVDNMLDAYIADGNQGEVSPVLIRYGVNTGDWSPGHWIMLIGRNEDGSYQAIGPWGDGSTTGEYGTVYIENGRISSVDGFSHLKNEETWPVHAYTQYSLNS